MVLTLRKNVHFEETNTEPRLRGQELLSRDLRTTRRNTCFSDVFMPSVA